MIIIGTLNVFAAIFSQVTISKNLLVNQLESKSNLSLNKMINNDHDGEFINDKI